MQKGHFHIALATAVAVALSLGAGNASALELNIYGVGHLSADNNDDGANSQLYIASNSSRLGFKGNHDLVKGMKVIFQYESGVDLTGRGENDGNGPGTSNNLFSTARDSFVGLSGVFGSVMAGRLGVLNQWLYDYNLFADQVGDLGNIWGGTGLPGRANGVLAYATPNIANLFDGLLAFIPENGTEDMDSAVLKLNFKIGSIGKIGGAFTTVGTGTGNPEHNAAAITGSYSIGNFTVGGGYQIESDIGGVSGDDRNSITLGGSFSFGNGHTVKIQGTNSDADLPDANATQIAVGYDYAVDKAFTVYVAYASTDNDANASFTANNYGHGQAVSPANGNDPASFSLGAVYKFDVGLVK